MRLSKLNPFVHYRSLCAFLTLLSRASNGTKVLVRFPRVPHREAEPFFGSVAQFRIAPRPDAVADIALNRTAKWAIEQCYRRALGLGATEPDHYLFPFRINRKKWDPARPASRWFLRKSWDKLRAATGFTQLNPHDLRHQCITRLLENGVMPETVRAIAGHVTEEMMQYYSHIRRQAKYDAVMAIELNERERVKQGPRAVKRSA